MSDGSSKKPKPFQRRRALAVKGGRDEDRTSTRLTARGAGKLADKIIALAEEHGIPVKEDPDLVSLLARLDLEQAIPPELYPLVAELLGFAYELNKAAGGEEADATDEAAGATRSAEEEEAGEEELEVHIQPGEATLDDLPKTDEERETERAKELPADGADGAGKA